MARDCRQLVREYLDQMQDIAARMERWSGTDQGELLSYGFFGLMDAAEKWRPRRKGRASFKTYAGIRIRGAIRDGMRQLDPLPRRMRKAAKETGFNPLLSIHEFLNYPDLSNGGGLNHVFESEQRQIMARAIEHLPKIERCALLLLFYDGLSQERVARRMRTSQSVVNNVKNRALARLLIDPTVRGLRAGR